MASAASNTIYRTYTQPDGTKKRTAFRVNVDYFTDDTGKPTGFETQLQNDLVAQDAGITGGGVNATWTTGAKLLTSNVWERQYRDTSNHDLGFVTPDEGWLDLTDRKSNFSSQVNDAAADALAKRFNSAGFGLDFGMATKAGASLQLANYQGINKAGSGIFLDAPSGTRQTSLMDSIKSEEGTREKYGTDGRNKETLYYPTALRNNKGQDRLQIQVLKYRPRPQGEAVYKLGDRAAASAKDIIGSCILPVPGGVGDTNLVSWGPDSADPASLAMGQAVFDGLQDQNPMEALGKNVENAVGSISGEKGSVKAALAQVITKQATGVGNMLTRKTGAIVNPNMELLFNAPQLRPFAFTYRLSPRSREESVMVKKIIRMFKQSMSVKRTKSTLFLKSPDTYQLKWLTGFGKSNQHEFLPRIKECALQGFNVNYTPDGNYATYEDTSMVAYEIQFQFSELEPIYNDDYHKIDGNSDSSICY